ncbi:MAG TPA: L-serine ammonia-lyase, partial [Burkholderiales bacterium]|nr:L-serine ammonia-lyase [Burkholderiales bacterium]
MISIFDIFKIGIGPSSSHTVGPMKAAAAFMSTLGAGPRSESISRLSIRLFGSLACTGKGHCTDKAVTLGLAGHVPDTIDPDEADRLWEAACRTRRLRLPDGQEIDFDPARDIVFDTAVTLPRHSNALKFSALDPTAQSLTEEVWYSVGGGFIVRDGDEEHASSAAREVPFPFRSASELLTMCRNSRRSIADIARENERALRPRREVDDHIARVARTMFSCIDNGVNAEGVLPGGLKVRRRARDLYRRLQTEHREDVRAPHEAMDCVSIYAIAVNEENAAGRRVVTEPTNGGAGVVPAVLRYYRDHCPSATDEGLSDFLLTAAAIGGLYKMNASISAAEVGCQGEIGVACSMAA